MVEHRFVDAHGVEVFSRWWPVDDGETRGVVLIAHGASEHSGRYDRFARALNAAGFAAAALDQRGHGHTGAATGAGTTGPGGGQAIVDDLHELRALVPTLLGVDGVPVVLFGHSLGSVIALAYLAQHADGLAGSILSGTPVDVRDAPGLGELLAGFAELRDAPAGELLGANNAGFEPARTGFDWLTRDEDEVDRYLADPFCGDDNQLTYGYLIDLFDVVGPAVGELDAIDHPVLVIAGDRDAAAADGAHPTALAEHLRAAGVEVELRLYEGARHELLNETNRDEVTADVIAWLEQR